MQLLTVSYVPLALILLVVAADIYRAATRHTSVRQVTSLRVAELIAAITWISVYVEQTTRGDIEFFDSGGPMVAAAAVIAIPVCLALAGRRWRDAVAARGRATVYGFSVPLLVVGVVPGIYLLTYYALTVFGPVP